MWAHISTYWHADVSSESKLVLSRLMSMSECVLVCKWVCVFVSVRVCVWAQLHVKVKKANTQHIVRKHTFWIKACLGRFTKIYVMCHHKNWINYCIQWCAALLIWLNDNQIDNWSYHTIIRSQEYMNPLINPTLSRSVAQSRPDSILYAQWEHISRAFVAQ
jgi:hypothetical protein